jgi:hypothetical protein
MSFIFIWSGHPRISICSITKPELQKRNGELCPKEMFEGKQLAFIRSRPTLLGTSKESKYEFKKCGKSGIQISNLLPNLQTVADDMCFIRTLHTEQFNHAPAQMFMQTDSSDSADPSLGAWTNYGIGSPNKDLPGFVVMVTGPISRSRKQRIWKWFSPVRVSRN